MSALEAASEERFRSDFDKGTTIHGGLQASFGKVSEKVSALGLNILMLHGDVVNFFKFLCPVFSWSPSINIPGFDLFNGVSGTLVGGVFTSTGVKARRQGKETGDRAGIAEGNWTVEIGVTLVASSVLKLGYAGLGILNYFRVLPEVLVPLIGTLGVLNGIFTVFMFIGFAVRAAFREREVHKFREGFRETLLTVLPGIELPEKGTPEELFVTAAKASNTDENELALRIVGGMRDHMCVGAIVEGCRDLLQPQFYGDVRHDLTDWGEILEKDVPVMLDDAERIFKQIRDLHKDDASAQGAIQVKFDRIAELRAQWNDKVNYENLITRATKGDIVTEICQGYPMDAKRGVTARSVITHLSEKWVERRKWNRVLGVLAVVGVGLVIFLLTATSGPLAIIASGSVVALFLFMALFFDGRGVVGELGTKNPGKWDGVIFLSATVLLAAIITMGIIVTVSTGGGLPLAYCIVVGSLLMMTQLIQLGWTVKRLGEQRIEIEKKKVRPLQYLPV